MVDLDFWVEKALEFNERLSEKIRFGVVIPMDYFFKTKAKRAWIQQIDKGVAFDLEATFRDLAFHQEFQDFDGCIRDTGSGPEDSHNSVFIKVIVIPFGDDPSHDDQDVFPAQFL